VVELAAGFLKPGGLAFHYRTEETGAFEVPELSSQCWSESYEVSECEIKRTVVFQRKLKPISAAYPRKPKKILKKPLF
jgi:hypothetical protein